MIYPIKEFLPEALAAFSSRAFDAAKDLPRFLKDLDLNTDRVCTIRQVHGAEVLRVTGPLQDKEADALITQEGNLALTIRTADCVPIFLLDRRCRAIGICHAGWRGAQKQIVVRTVEGLRESFGTKPGDLVAAIGPAICAACYEVGGEFLSYFPDQVRKADGKYFFDLVGELKSQLVHCGVLPSALIDSKKCTACSVDKFFSARREGRETGRFLSVIVLRARSQT